ncbi:MAG: DUF3310 domain-containing protein [Clostridia bacterium]
MKFNLGNKVRIKSNGVVGIIIARGYNEYLDENDRQQSFEEYQIEADKYYQCNEDEIELITIGQALQSIYDIPPQIKRKYCGNCCEFDKSTGICEYDNIAVCRDSGICENYYPSVQEVEVEDINDPVNHPSHYCDGNIEVIDFIIDKKLNFNRGNVIKYTSRAGKKNPNKEVEDLEKARFYLNKEIEILKGDK